MQSHGCICCNHSAASWSSWQSACQYEHQLSVHNCYAFTSAIMQINAFMVHKVTQVILSKLPSSPHQSLSMCCCGLSMQRSCCLFIYLGMCIWKPSLRHSVTISGSLEVTVWRPRAVIVCAFYGGRNLSGEFYVSLLPKQCLEDKELDNCSVAQTELN